MCARERAFLSALPSMWCVRVNGERECLSLPFTLTVASTSVCPANASFSRHMRMHSYPNP